MKISEHFSLEELTVTTLKLDNIPMQTELDNLRVLAEKVLEPLRLLYSKPIKINSGYRSPAVNRAIGGSSSSQHMKGQAADITGGNKKENKKLFDLIKDNLEFDQLINESDYSWVHVSYNKDKNRNQKLKMINGKYFNT